MKFDFTRKQKALIIIIAIFLLLDTLVLLDHFVFQKYTTVPLYFSEVEFAPQKMRALNSKAYSGAVSNGKYAYFSFTDSQSNHLAEYYSYHEAVSIRFSALLHNYSGKRYQKAVSAPQQLYFGFLYADDFDKKGHIKKSSKERILAGSDLRQFLHEQKGTFSFDFSLALSKNLEKTSLPKGIMLYSEYPIQLKSFYVEPARVGFDFTGNSPFFGVSANGGNLSADASNIDFSGATTVFPVENSRFSAMPVLTMGFLPCDDYGTSQNQLAVKVNAGGDVFSVRRTRTTNECVIQTSTLLSPFSSYSVTEHPELVTKMIMSSNSSDVIVREPGKILVPLKTDPGLILTSKERSWRSAEYEVYEWDRFPGVLIFDTANYEVQADFFRRLAFFAEKVGYRGRILTDEELGTMHGYNAHDYSAHSLAEFFSKAQVLPGVLNEKELILKELLLKNGIIIEEQGGYREGSGAVISISRESSAYLRNSFISHESWHGIFFINEDFRNTVAAVYYTVDSLTRDFITGYWKSQPTLGYDPEDEYLMHNEFMAYIMQQSLENVGSYFVHLANRGSVIAAMPDLCAWVRANKGSTFEDAGRVFDSYAFDNWGLACGRVSLVNRVR